MNMNFKEFMKTVFVKQTYDKKDDAIFENKWGPDDDDPEPDPEEILKKKKPEKEKEIKRFNVGDVLELADDKKPKKIPEDAWDFLMTFKTFTVLQVKENGKIDVGCKISKNEPDRGVEKDFFFNPNRFKLLKAAEVEPSKAEPQASIEEPIDPHKIPWKDYDPEIKWKMRFRHLDVEEDQENIISKI